MAGGPLGLSQPLHLSGLIFLLQNHLAALISHSYSQLLTCHSPLSSSSSTFSGFPV